MLCACLFTTSGSVVFLEFSHNQDKTMKEETLELRLKAIEYAISRISIAISEGTSPHEFSEEIKHLRKNLTSESLTSDNEALLRRTVMILDPLNGDPWDPF